MSEIRSLSPLSEMDYGAIEAAVMETARGRWFLSEFARRNRHAETNVLLDAMKRIEQAVSGERAVQQIEHVRFDLMEMAKTIARLKVEVATAGTDGEQSRFMEATEVLDAVVRTTECATSSILESAEQIQEAAWTLREAGADHALCDVLDRRAADIYTACTFQDLTAQRTQKVVRTLRFLEGRINALIDAWSTGGNATAGPQAGPRPAADDYENEVLNLTAPLSQSDVDVVIVDDYSLSGFDSSSAASETQDMSRAAGDRDLQATNGLSVRTSAMSAEKLDRPEAVAPPNGMGAGTDRVSLHAIDGLSDTEKLIVFR
jgi:chemotaxis regulatin CheY-phosphate phosphatase CheZ